MHLFSNIKYQLSDQEIESIFHPGTTMMGLLKYQDDFSKSQGLNQLWYKDTSPTASITAGVNAGYAVRHEYVIKSPNPKGNFSFAVPLKNIFGFAEDYDKIVLWF